MKKTPFSTDPGVRVRKVPVRSKGQTTQTFSLPLEMKLGLHAVALQTDRDIAQIIRYALEFQNERSWKDIPEVSVFVKGQKIEELIKKWQSYGELPELK